MDAVGMSDWPLDDYQPLPYWKTSQVFEDSRQGYDFYGITFKEALHTFADTVAMPWLSEVSEKDGVHGGILINRQTAESRGIANGQRVRLVSPAGNIEVAAWVRNLMDKRYKTYAFDASFFSRVVVNFVGEPRTIGLDLSISW